MNGRSLDTVAPDRPAAGPQSTVAGPRGDSRRALFDTAPSAACRGADIVLICVKPRDVAGVLAELMGAGALAHAPLVVSVAAGVSIAAIEGAVAAAAGGRVPVVRAMPNTASVIGLGCTVLSGGTHATAAHLGDATAIFSAVGRCLELDERHLDAVTAVSASGPAFIYVVFEALKDDVPTPGGCTIAGRCRGRGVVRQGGVRRRARLGASA